MQRLSCKWGTDRERKEENLVHDELKAVTKK
jgi:hypothetical protein